MKIVILSWYPSYINRDILSLISQTPQHPYPWVFNLAKGLVKLENEVHIITFNKEITFDQEITVNDVIIHYLKPSDSVSKFLTNFKREKQKLYKLIDDIKPDIIHGQSTEFPANEVINLDYPSVITLHGLTKDFYKLAIGFKNKLRLLYGIKVEKKVLKKIKNLILISKYVEDSIKNINPEINKYYICNSVAEDFFHKNANFESNQIMFIGNDVERKGLFEIVKAIESIENVFLLIISTDQTRYYKNVILPYIKSKNLDSKIKYYKFIENSKIPEQIANSICLVLPTKAETAPMIIGEANAVGVPVIASNVGGIPYMIKDSETGFIIKNNDTKTLRDKIRFLINNKNIAKEMGSKAKELAFERYHPESIARQTLEVYKNIVNNKQ
ncbi:MAG: glycosyltransferase family 4 protein [Bacteroidota bacterium]|nr:glycosyltransferase family 4 protein [Bacteroidota bacterium]